MNKTIRILLGLTLINSSNSFAAITAFWANEGGDKVAQDELRVGRPNGRKVINSVWDGTTINIFGAKNEVVNFNLVLESLGTNNPTNGVSVVFNTLTGPGRAKISSVAKSGDNLFNYVGRNIELFMVRYLPINGLSNTGFDEYDERLLPERFRRPSTLTSTDSIPLDPAGKQVALGNAGTGWWDRPDAGQYYPEIAAPMETSQPFGIWPDTNSSVWADIYIPKTATAGLYTGKVKVSVNGALVKTIPVRLTVNNFTLPDVPTAKTMLYYEAADVNERFFGKAVLRKSAGDNVTRAEQIQNRYFLMAHRHKISLIGDNNNLSTNSYHVDANGIQDQPSEFFKPKIYGSFFSAANGYDGPGVGTQNNVYSIFTYGIPQTLRKSPSALQTNAKGWVDWFNTYSVATEKFMYLTDEPEYNSYSTVEAWAATLKNNPKTVGNPLKSFCTVPLPDAAVDIPGANPPTKAFGFMPSLSIVASSEHGNGAEDPRLTPYDFTNNPIVKRNWEALSNQYVTDPNKGFFVYNGAPPASGAFFTDADGMSLRANGWIQYKKNIQRWFYWNATYYRNFQSNMPRSNPKRCPDAQTVDLFQNAHTFGSYTGFDPISGDSSTPGYGYTYLNGDGVLMYPGTDVCYPASSYALNGPIASLRLKHWRRGIQDADYLQMAYQRNPAAVDTIVARLIPKVLWEVNGWEEIYQFNDPISWSTDPDLWEKARKELANIILTGNP